MFMNHQNLINHTCSALIVFCLFNAPRAQASLTQTKGNWFTNWWHRKTSQPIVEAPKILPPVQVKTISENHFWRDSACIAGTLLFAASVYGYSQSSEWRSKRNLGVVKIVKGYFEYLGHIFSPTPLQQVEDLNFENTKVAEEEHELTKKLAHAEEHLVLWTNPKGEYQRQRLQEAQEEKQYVIERRAEIALRKRVMEAELAGLRQAAERQLNGAAAQ
jgi:hypothetical protein